MLHHNLNNGVYILNRKNLPKIAVLVAAYNGAEWIEEQIKTILSQDDVVVDIYVSVDLSTDGTFEMLQKYELTESRIHLLEYGDRYGGAAKNFFRLIRDVEFSDYDYVAFSDQDDIWLSNKLALAVSKIKSSDVDAYSSDVLAFWNDGSKKLIKKSYPQKKFDFLFEAAGPGCTYVLKAAALAEFKKKLIINWAVVNEIELHDWLIYAYFRANKLKWLIDPLPLMYYRQHSANQVGVNRGLKAYLVRLKKVRYKWYRTEVERIAFFIDFQVPKLSFMLLNFLQIRRRTRDAFILLSFVLLGLY